MIPVSYTINRVKIKCQRTSLLRFILIYLPYIHDIHSLSRKNARHNKPKKDVRKAVCNKTKRKAKNEVAG
jgi:hypothetical protein